MRELTKNLDNNVVINSTIEFGNEWSIRGAIDCIHICPKENNYANEDYITLTQVKTNEKDSLIIRELTGKNQWHTKTLKG